MDEMSQFVDTLSRWLQSGKVWRTCEPNVCLSCAFIVRRPEVYAQLTSRLRGPNPLYYVTPSPALRREMGRTHA